MTTPRTRRRSAGTRPSSGRPRGSSCKELDSKLSFIAAALIGAEEIARTLDRDDGRDLAAGVNAVMHEALRLRRGVREELRAFDDEVGREWGVGQMPEGCANSVFGAGGGTR